MIDAHLEHAEPMMAPDWWYPKPAITTPTRWQVLLAMLSGTHRPLEPLRPGPARRHVLLGLETGE